MANIGKLANFTCKHYGKDREKSGHSNECDECDDCDECDGMLEMVVVIMK